MSATKAKEKCLFFITLSQKGSEFIRAPDREFSELHIGRAIEMELKEIINHFSHKHQLRLSENKDGKVCHVCFKNFAPDMIYWCQEGCYHRVCPICAKLSQRITHAFHPHHSLLCLQTGDSCWACGMHTSGYMFQCDECRFTLDFRCAALSPTNPHPDGRQVFLINHQYPLILCDRPDEFNNDECSCHCCCKPIEKESVYFCLQCRYLIHESCAALPKQIRHPIHRQHFLMLVTLSRDSRAICSVCKWQCKNFGFGCSNCGIVMHILCAALVLKGKECGTDDHGYHEIQFQPVSHPHSLIKCEKTEYFLVDCFGCSLPFEDFIYFCPQCCICLHKSCSGLPRTIVHALHPQHSLVLYENLYQLWESNNCRGCSSGIGFFIYLCQECDFFLDLRCATVEFPVIIRSTAHRHALALFETIRTKQFDCNICHRPCSNYFFRCVECDFNIHDHCHPNMPQTIKHDCHCDPLTFTTSQIRDIPDEGEEEDAEVYCHACEETRNLADPTYYCAECHFVAHVHCVLSEIIPYLENKYEATLSSGVHNVKLESSNEATAEGSNSSVIATEEDKGVDGVQELIEGVATIGKEIDEIRAKIDLANAILGELMTRLKHLQLKKNQMLAKLQLQQMLHSRKD